MSISTHRRYRLLWTVLQDACAVAMYDHYIINIFAKFVMLILTHRRYRLACTVLHDASVAAPIIFVAPKSWLHYSKMGFLIVPTISPSYLSIWMDFWAASWRVFSTQLLATNHPAMWQKGWLVVVFRNVFSAKLFNWKFTPCSAIFCHSPSMTFKTPRPTPRSSHGFNPTTRKRSRAIDHASGENCDFLIWSII